MCSRSASASWREPVRKIGGTDEYRVIERNENAWDQEKHMSPTLMKRKWTAVSLREQIAGA